MLKLVSALLCSSSKSVVKEFMRESSDVLSPIWITKEESFEHCVWEAETYELPAEASYAFKHGRSSKSLFFWKASATLVCFEVGFWG